MGPTSNVSVGRNEVSQENSAGTDLKPGVVAIVSGSSGVGTSTIAANIVVALARSSKRVCLFDAGSGSSNATEMLKVPAGFSISQLVRSGHPYAQMLPGGPEGVKVFPAAAALTQYLKPGVPGQKKIAGLLESLETSFDYFVIDLDSSLSAGTLHFAAAAQVLTVVITPDPKSLSQTFLLLKTLQRKAKLSVVVQVVLNMAENARSAAGVYQRFSETVKKFLGIDTEFLGSVWIDKQLASSILEFRLVANMPITEPACRTFFRLTRRMADVFKQKNLPKNLLSSRWQPLPKNLASRKLTNSSSQSKVAASKMSRKIKMSGDSAAIKKLVTDGRSEKDVRSGETAWLRFYKQLVRSLICKGKKSAYIAQLLTICVESKGFAENKDRAETKNSGEQIDIVEPLLGLLSELSAESFTADQRVQLNILVKNLLGESHQPKAKEMDDAARDELKLPEGSPVYDAHRFGNQQDLLSRLREASLGQPVNSLLDAIKYAAKVDMTN